VGKFRGRAPVIIAFISGRSVVLVECSGAIPPKMFASPQSFFIKEKFFFKNSIKQTLSP